MKGFVWLTKRVDELEDRVEKMERLKCQPAVLPPKEDCDRAATAIAAVREAAEANSFADAVKSIMGFAAFVLGLETPLELYKADIEKIFRHKIKIVDERDRE